MGQPSDISEAIIDALYYEALMLADDVRAVFDLKPVETSAAESDRVRLALSVEGLRTTTRIMHVLAWLLNQRAYHAGEMSEFQLRRHGILPEDRPSEQCNLDLFEEPTCELIAATQAIHARVSRLDGAWRDKFRMQPSAVHRLRERIGREVLSAS